MWLMHRRTKTENENGERKRRTKTENENGERKRRTKTENENGERKPRSPTVKGGPQAGVRKELSLIAASNSAHAPAISLNRYRPTATVVATVIGIVVIASVLALEVGLSRHHCALDSMRIEHAKRFLRNRACRNERTYAVGNSARASGFPTRRNACTSRGSDQRFAMKASSPRAFPPILPAAA
jgi:hypothetical protein